MKIGVISGTKASDAYICKILLSQFPGSKIICYKIPFHMWLPWLRKRIATLGCSVFIGHMLLSIFLRSERFIERLCGRSIWKTFKVGRPSWMSIPNVQLSFSEENLAEKLKDVACVIATDTFQYSPKFFKTIQKPFIQVVWGSTPHYFGDSGAFWAFAKDDTSNVGVSVILRRSQFQYYRLLEWIPVPVSNADTIRTIKVKQVIALGEKIPYTIQRFLSYGYTKEGTANKVQCRNWYAPTLRTFVRFIWAKKYGRMFHIPSYACKEYVGFLF